MSVEPGIVDTNVLVYALDADAPQHAAARALLETAREASITLFTTSQILYEFYSIVTNPRRVSKPRSAADTLTAISGLLAFLHVLPVPAHTIDGWMDLLRRHPVTGGDVFDLQIIATMQANGVQRIYTFNTADFEIFSELSIVTPQAWPMIFLRRTDPTKNIDRFYVVSLTPTLLGEWTLLREWGRRGSPGTVRRQSFANEDEAEKAVQRVVRRLLRHGYEQAEGFAPEPKVAAKPDGIKGDA